MPLLRLNTVQFPMAMSYYETKASYVIEFPRLSNLSLEIVDLNHHQAEQITIALFYRLRLIFLS